VRCQRVRARNGPDAKYSPLAETFAIAQLGVSLGGFGVFKPCVSTLNGLRKEPGAPTSEPRQASVTLRRPGPMPSSFWEGNDCDLEAKRSSASHPQLDRLPPLECGYCSGVLM
jgi:hypothetical protein